MKYYNLETHHPWTLTSFVPISIKHVSEPEADWLVVLGCAHVVDRGRKASWGAFILMDSNKAPHPRIELLVGLKKRGGNAACEDGSSGPK